MCCCSRAVMVPSGLVCFPSVVSTRYVFRVFPRSMCPVWRNVSVRSLPPALCVPAPALEVFGGVKPIECRREPFLPPTAFPQKALPHTMVPEAPRRAHGHNGKHSPSSSVMIDGFFIRKSDDNDDDDESNHRSRRGWGKAAGRESGYGVRYGEEL